MHSIPFSKMSVNGNNFVILDETQQPVLSEPQKSGFAYFATDTNFGVGCDNMLVVQACTDDMFMEINTHRTYWKQLPEASCADYVFRIFEPSGEEALSCGNGLKCLANYQFSSAYNELGEKVQSESKEHPPVMVDLRGPCSTPPSPHNTIRA